MSDKSMIRWFVAASHLVQVRHGRVVRAVKTPYLRGKSLKEAKRLTILRRVPFYEVQFHDGKKGKGKSMNVDVSHQFDFEFTREPSWPDSIPVPDDNPEFGRSYIPQGIVFSVQCWHEDIGKPKIIFIYGALISGAGEKKAGISCKYLDCAEIPVQFREQVRSYTDVAVGLISEGINEYKNWKPVYR